MADSFDGTPYSAIPAVPDTSGSGDSAAPEAAPQPTAFDPLGDAVRAFLNSGGARFTYSGTGALVEAHPPFSAPDSGPGLSDSSGELSRIADADQQNGTVLDGPGHAGEDQRATVAPLIRLTHVPPSVAPMAHLFESPPAARPSVAPRPPAASPSTRPRPEHDADSSFFKPGPCQATPRGTGPNIDSRSPFGPQSAARAVAVTCDPQRFAAHSASPGAAH